MTGFPASHAVVSTSFNHQIIPAPGLDTCRSRSHPLRRALWHWESSHFCRDLTFIRGRHGTSPCWTQNLMLNTETRGGNSLFSSSPGMSQCKKEWISTKHRVFWDLRIILMHSYLICSPICLFHIFIPCYHHVFIHVQWFYPILSPCFRPFPVVFVHASAHGPFKKSIPCRSHPMVRCPPKVSSKAAPSTCAVYDEGRRDQCTTLKGRNGKTIYETHRKMVV